MSDLIVALGLVLIIEGVLLAAFPNAVRSAMEAMERLPDTPLRLSGLVGAMVGLLVVWLMRG